MQQLAESAVFWGALLVGLAAFAILGRHLLREVRRKKTGRFVAVILYGAATPLMAMVPMSIAYLARWVGMLAGFPLFPKASADDGVMVGIGIIGMLVAIGCVALFALVMMVQALTGPEDSQSDTND